MGLCGNQQEPVALQKLFIRSLRFCFPFPRTFRPSLRLILFPDDRHKSRGEKISCSFMICTSKYYSSDEIKKSVNGGACSTQVCGETRNACGFLVSKPEGKKLLRRSKLKLECNIKVNLTETGWEDADLINAVQVRDKGQAVVNAVMNFRAP
jgi:hypothetical protein